MDANARTGLGLLLGLGLILVGGAKNLDRRWLLQELHATGEVTFCVPEGHSTSISRRGTQRTVSCSYTAAGRNYWQTFPTHLDPWSLSSSHAAEALLITYAPSDPNRAWLGTLPEPPSVIFNWPVLSGAGLIALALLYRPRRPEAEAVSTSAPGDAA